MSQDQLPAPTVSIGLPVYNGANYLEQTLNSIVSQTYTDFELIIGDNCSTDDTAEICETFAANDPRIRYVRHKKNLGAAANYNSVFQAAQGKYFKWAAHDDLLELSYLERCLDYFAKDSDLLLVHPATVVIDEEGNQSHCYLDHLDCADPDPVKRYARWMMPHHGMCNPVFGLIKQEVMAQTCLHGDYIGADRVFLGEIALRGRSRAFRETLFLSRVHRQQSHTAQTNFQDLEWWYRGSKSRRLSFKFWRMLGEHIRILHRVDLPWRDRLRCYPILGYWAIIRGDRLLRELLIPLHANGQWTPLARWLAKPFSRSRNGSDQNKTSC